MYIKIFFPFLILLLIQLLGFFFYEGFSFSPSYLTKIVVILTYVISITTILFFCIINKNFKGKLNINYEDKTNRFFSILFFLVTILFINKPTITLYFLGQELGFDYIRDKFFSLEALRASVFGSATIAAMTLMYITPILWFYTILLIGKKDKISVFLFYYTLFSLVLFNLSYAGRFYIYFALIVLYLKNTLEGGGVLLFFKKYILLVSLFIFSSFFILNVRTNSDYVAQNNDNQALFSMIEYHLMQPFFWAQKVDTGTFSGDTYPFKLIIESVFFPLFYLAGKGFSDISYGYYANEFGAFTLYSIKTGSSYNAFATLYAYLYSDFGVFTPFFSSFFIMWIFFLSKIIKDVNIRLKYLSFFCLMLYFSLFQAPIFSPGSLLILLILPFVLKFKFKY